jgi:hypothetical protein
MATRFISKLILLGGIVLFTACNRPECNNNNPIFSKFSPENKAYKDELIKQLKSQSKTDLTYWFEQYHNQNGKEYIQVRIQGADLCAEGMLLVQNWGKLENIQRVEGKGYRGAELKNLKFETMQDEVNTELVYQDIEAIID